jgi:hypothetical protein
VIVYAHRITPRLRHTLDFIGKELTGQPAIIICSKNDYFSYQGVKINYSNERIIPDEFWLKPHPLLFEAGIKEQDISCFECDNQKAFFKTEGNFPFDIFAASFYLLSRYEEYLPHKKDMYGRYAHESSLAFKEGFLNTPLINIWLQGFRKSLQLKFSSFTIHHSPFTFLPTYDIDEAFSFKHKQWHRSAGGAVKDLLRGQFNRFSQRRRVLNNIEPDPFDSFAWMNDLHRPYKFKPRYFFLVAEQNGKVDKNNLPSTTAMQTLIRQHAEKYSIGVHPSWQSGDDFGLLKKEKEIIEDIAKIKITASRQHFIRFTLPETFRRLIDAGIKEDFSMGYGSINGFRASVASPFYWYDLVREQATNLLLYPFCYMEANSYYEQRLSPQQALEEMQHYYNEVKKISGTLITIWHNTFLGTDAVFKGWREVYAEFVKEVAE